MSVLTNRDSDQIPNASAQGKLENTNVHADLMCVIAKIDFEDVDLIKMK